MQQDRPLFISTSHEMAITWQTYRMAPDGPGKTMALEHVQAAQAAFEKHDEPICLEQCRAAAEALD